MGSIALACAKPSEQTKEEASSEDIYQTNFLPEDEDDQYYDPDEQEIAVKKIKTRVEHWQKGKRIGSGSSAAVYIGLNRATGELLAIKEIALKSGKKELVVQAEEEISILNSVSHRNIVQFLGCTQADRKLYIFLEYVSGGSIKKMLVNFGRFDELMVIVYTRQILAGLSYLHRRRIIHRDIKGANILVDKSGTVKLSDFGTASFLADAKGATGLRGTPWWMAPEVVQRLHMGRQGDIWSLGCSVIEMCTAARPWPQFDDPVTAIFNIPAARTHPPIPDYVSPACVEFIKLCCTPDPGKRPTADFLLRSDLLRP